MVLIMTDRLYENDSYIKEFQAQVVSCVCAEDIFEQTQAPGKWAVVLNRTAFFPEGGGQSPDQGWLITDDEFRVYDVQIKDGIIYHRTDLFVQSNTEVTGKIHWSLRFSNMQQHSGEHIFSGLVHRNFGYDNVGFHLGSQCVTMDFNGILTNEDIDVLEREANQAVFENVPIVISYPDRETLEKMEYRSKIEIEGQVRIVTVQGYDICACCAPHVSHTGEIGLIKIVDCQKYKSGVRVSMLCGFRALEDYRKSLVESHRISRLLSAPVQDIGLAVERQIEDNKQLRQKLYERTGQLIVKTMETIPSDQENVWFFEEELEAATMRKIVNLALEKVQCFAGVFCGKDGDGYQYVIGTKSGDARNAADILKNALGARGGGKSQMVQGFVQGTKTEIENVLSGGNI